MCLKNPLTILTRASYQISIIIFFINQLEC